MFQGGTLERMKRMERVEHLKRMEHAFLRPRTLKRYDQNAQNMTRGVIYMTGSPFRMTKPRPGYDPRTLFMTTIYDQIAFRMTKTHFI